MYTGKDGKLVAWNQALTSDMIFVSLWSTSSIRSLCQLYLWSATGHNSHRQDRAAPEVAKLVGKYAELGRMAKGHWGSTS
jgi:hypothetical protein